MGAAVLGRKIGMTRLYDADGRSVPVTVIEVGPCFVSQVKAVASDGYQAVQLAYGVVKARNSTVPRIGHNAKAGLEPTRILREVRCDGEEVSQVRLGQAVTVAGFEGVKYVDIVGTSKGKGFAGTMKRWGFKCQQATHGVERKHRSPGSVGGRSSNLGTGKPKKGIKMAGRMGGGRVTVRSLELMGVNPDKNLIWVKGAVPGANQSVVLVRQARRLNKSKGRRVRAA